MAPSDGDDDVLLGDLLGETDLELELELEARFQELERQADLDAAHADMSEAAHRARSAAPGAPWAGPRATASASPPAAEDPLKDLKAAFEPKPDAGTKEYLLVVCPSPSCGRKNRLDRARAVTGEPRCGACGASLVFRR